MNERSAARYGLTAEVLALGAAATLASGVAGIAVCIVMFRGAMSWTDAGMLAMALLFVMGVVLLAPLYLYVERRIRLPLARLQRELETVDVMIDCGRDEGFAGPRELVELADGARRLKSRVHTRIREPTQLLAALSHDLRTPIARIELRLEQVDHAAREGLARDVACMTQILDEALGYLRRGSLSDESTRVDLAELLRSVCAQFVDVGHAVSYDGPASLEVLGRPSALKRAIGNLLGNALKHASWAALRLRSLSDERVEILVEDDGTGIAAPLQEQVFEPFFRGDTSTAGLGLGLTIARDVIASHGGTIELHERLPRGLIVRVTLPRERSLVPSAGNC